MDLDAYFARIGWSGSREPTLEALTGLCLRHTASIPFENLDILRGKPIRVDLPAIVDKLVTRRRGGYCFEQNTLFQAVLAELGFRVSAFGARVCVGQAQGAESARTHLLLRVDLRGRAYIVDVGFGRTPTGPLLLEPGLEQQLHLGCYRLVREATRWRLELRAAQGFTPEYVFTEEPWFPIDTEVANHYTSTHPASFFTLAPFVIRQDPEHGVYFVLHGREWSEHRGANVKAHALSSSDEVTRVLARHFGLELPPDTRWRGLD